MYTKSESAQFQKVMSVFKSYTSNTKLFEIMWSPMVGFTFINYDHLDSFAILSTAEQLCELLLREIAAKILIERHSHILEPSRASKAAKTAILKRFRPYLRQLPEYRHLASKILNPPTN